MNAKMSLNLDNMHPKDKNYIFNFSKDLCICTKKCILPYSPTKIIASRSVMALEPSLVYLHPWNSKL